MKTFNDLNLRHLRIGLTVSGSLIGLVFLILPTGGVRGQVQESPAPKLDSIEVMVLGVAQDAGFPQAGCRKNCCDKAWKDPSLRRHVCSLAVLDHQTNQRWLFDCSPSFPDQLRMMDDRLPVESNVGIDGIFLTHAHIGHYTGLMNLGREVMGAKEIAVYGMPRMRQFLASNGPWNQLVSLKNIQLMSLNNQQPIRLSDRLSVTAFLVPHRDEFSETVGFVIAGPSKRVAFLPDIDKWSKWDRSIEDLIESVDVAYLDGTFFENGEIPGRDMALIPHPFVMESIRQFGAIDIAERNKVRFIHFNHTNPVLHSGSNARRQVEQAGMRIARQGEVFELSGE